jgi:hypothetical protein
MVLGILCENFRSTEVSGVELWGFEFDENCVFSRFRRLVSQLFVE